MRSFIAFALSLSVLGAPLVPHPTATTLAAQDSVSTAGPATPARADAPEPGSFPERWISGGPDCGTEPALQVHAYNRDLFILRQSLCTSFEAPFIY